MVDEPQLLNLQHNRITAVQRLAHLRGLVHLDLSDNRLTGMAGLEGLPSLRVLLLGRNRWAWRSSSKLAPVLGKGHCSGPESRPWWRELRARSDL